MTDNRDRYYLNVFSQNECNNVNGFWDNNVPNKQIKNKQGVCWKTNTDKYCSEKYRIGKPMTIYARDKCNNDNNCHWVSDLNECLDKNKSNEYDEETNRNNT